MGSAVPVAVLLLAVLLGYAGAFAGTFQFDDFNVIADNPAVQSWAAWWESMPGIRPVLKLSYVLSWTGGWGEVGFHAFNVACHGANAVLVHAAIHCL